MPKKIGIFHVIKSLDPDRDPYPEQFIANKLDQDSGCEEHCVQKMARTPETGFLNGDCGRRAQVNLRSRARWSNSIGRGIQPDQWRPRTGGLLPTVPFKESTSGVCANTAW